MLSSSCPSSLSVLIATLLLECSTAAGMNWSLEKIKEQIASNRAATQSIEVSYRSEHLATERPAVRKVAAAAATFRYERQWHESFADWREDPAAHMRYFDGQQFNVFYPHTRKYEVTRKYAVSPYVDKIRACLYFEAIGWWPPDDSMSAPRPLGDPFAFHEILDDNRCTIVPIVPDGDVLISIPGHIRIVYDPHKAVMRYREHSRPNKAGKAQVVVTFTMSNFREIEPGLWFPMTIERFIPNPLYHTRHLVNSLRINEIKSDGFAFAPPPGTHVIDRDTDTARQIPGGLDLLERRARDLLNANGYRMPFTLAQCALGLLAGVCLSVIATWTKSQELTC